jgi:hypothetical protein
VANRFLVVTANLDFLEINFSMKLLLNFYVDSSSSLVVIFWNPAI